MEYATIAGNYYTITSKTGCTVTDTTGTLSMTVDAGGQLTVQAPSDKLVYDDEQAIVFKANFNYALAALDLLGGGADKLPAGFTPLEFIETYSPRFEMPMAYNGQSGFRARGYIDFGNNGALCGHRDVYAVWQPPNSGELRAGTSASYVSLPLSSGKHNVEAEVNFLNSGVATLTLDGEPASGAINAARGSAQLFAIFGMSGYFSSGRVYELDISAGGKIAAKLRGAVDANGVVCFYDIKAQQPLYNNFGDGSQLIAGMTLSQVRGLRLPAGGGKLTLSLPHEASIDKMAQAALEQARANGWELTLQYAEAEVPAGYRRLVFLESTGEQYIDTGVIPDNETGILLDQEKLSKGDFIPMGCRNDNNNTRFYAFRTICAAEGNKSGYGWGGWEAVNEVIGRQTTKLNFMNSRKVEGGGSSIKLSELPFVPEQPIYMFAANIGGVPNLRWTGRIYEAEISQGEAAAMSFVPCIAPNGKLGMYNKIDGTLHENAGSGAFIAGLATVDDVRKLWLPETGGPLTVSVPSDTPDSAVEQLRSNNPTWQIAIQYRQ